MRETIDHSDGCRHRLPIVNRQLSSCDKCGSYQIKSDRSIDQGDGTRMKWVHCKVCEYRFIDIWE